jgi:hypothetical protein
MPPRKPPRGADMFTQAYEAQALIALGYPASGVAPRPRAEPEETRLVDRR